MIHIISADCEGNVYFFLFSVLGIPSINTTITYSLWINGCFGNIVYYIHTYNIHATYDVSYACVVLTVLITTQCWERCENIANMMNMWSNKHNKFKWNNMSIKTRNSKKVLVAYIVKYIYKHMAPGYEKKIFLE